MMSPDKFLSLSQFPTFFDEFKFNGNQFLPSTFDLVLFEVNRKLFHCMVHWKLKVSINNYCIFCEIVHQQL